MHLLEFLFTSMVFHGSSVVKAARIVMLRTLLEQIPCRYSITVDGVAIIINNSTKAVTTHTFKGHTL